MGANPTLDTMLDNKKSWLKENLEEARKAVAQRPKWMNIGIHKFDTPMKTKKSLRIRDCSVDNTLALCEIASLLETYKDENTPVICKFGNKNFRITSTQKKDGAFVLTITR